MVLEKIRPAFNLNTYAQQIGNIVLDDKSFLEKSIKHNYYWKNWLSKEFRKLGIKVIPSVANFITIIFNNSSKCIYVCKPFREKNILVRKLNAYKMNNCVRITIGTELQNKTLIKFSKKILKEINMILYDYPRAPNPMRVNLFINEKKIKIERVHVDLSKHQNLKPKIFKVKPMGNSSFS